MLVSEITQITAHEWNVAHKICCCITVHSSRALLESKIICCHGNSL